MRRRFGTIGPAVARGAVALTLLTGLLVAPGPGPAAAGPSVEKVVAALAAADTWDDDEYDWYRQTLVDIARYDTEPEVRTAASAALEDGSNAAVKAFVDTGWATARTAADQRRAKARKQVEGWASSGGPKVKEWANRALEDGDYAIGEFVAYGHELAKQLDHPVADTAAERERIRTRVEQMIAFGGPTVMAEGAAALGSGDPAVIADFYRSGYAEANRADYDTREAIRLAVQARNDALAEIAAKAEVAADAAAARAGILTANIEAMKLLDDALAAMQLGVTASRRADEILEEDKPGRQNGKRGRTADLEALRLEATTQAQRAAASATQSRSTVATVLTAAAKLLKTGQAHGVDWAKVTVAAGEAIQASAFAAETSQHAAEATLADSLALDADANAQLHAKNADKWLAAAKKQAETAKHLADVAKAQQKVAQDAAGRAKKQREIAEAASRRAGEHAGKARNARITAQSASNNAIGKSNAAIAAHGDAGRAAEAEGAAISRAHNAGRELDHALNGCYAAEDQLNKTVAALQKARDEAIAAGQDADAATKDLADAAARARSAYESASAWAARARAAAATARAEAERTSAAAKQARTAAAKADKEALTARRASEQAEVAARGAVDAAETAKLDAQRTETEAIAAVQESRQAVFQAEVADRAAGAAAASAELAVDKADAADWMASQFAGVNADARRIMQAAADAIHISEERQAAAEKRADEAAAAAARATEAAERAVGTVKEAYAAAAQAVQWANEAATAAVGAHNAAVDAANHANGANQAAARATRYEDSAWSDARIATGAAQTATQAATVAGRAATDADRLHTWAKGATAQIHALADELAAKLEPLATEQARQAAIAESKRKFEENFENGLKTVLNCAGPLHLQCQKVLDFLKDKGKDALNAGKEYLDNVAKCLGGDWTSRWDDGPCKAAADDNDRLVEFMKQVGIGLWEGAKGLVQGLKMLADCGSWVVLGTGSDYFQENCGKAVQQILDLPRMLREHPWEVIHLSEWQNNPGKALGLTLFDVGTFFVPGAGQVSGVLTKVVGGVGRLLSTTMAKLADGLATIPRITVKLGDGPGGIARLSNVTVKLDGGAAKLIEGVAKIDGRLYELQAPDLKLSGSAGDFANGVIHIEGGVVKLDGNIAKLENATVKVEKSRGPPSPANCGIRGSMVRSLAAGGDLCLGDQPDGSWIGEELGRRIFLSKELNDYAKVALREAYEREPSISTKVTEVIESVPIATKAGWEKRKKLPDSLKRKIAGDGKWLPNVKPADLVARIKDNVRYTMTFEFENYHTGVVMAMRAMTEKGFVLDEKGFKNNWANDKIYKGINSIWFDPETKQYFEMQFHTPKSFQVNRAEHTYYERRRILEDEDPNDPEIAELKAISKLMWGDVPTPEGAEKLKY